MLDNKNSSHFYLIAAVCLAVIIFAIDAQVELGVATAVPYVMVVVLGLWIPQRWYISVAVVVCSLLTLLGFFKPSPLSGEMWKVVANRGLSLFVIWVTGILCLLQKKETEALSDSEMFRHSIMDAIYDALIVIDATGTIIYFNQSATRCFGYSDSEIVGKNLNLLMPEPHKSRHDSYIKNYLETGIHKMLPGREVVGLKKNGETFPIVLFLTETVQNGRRLFIGLVRDITQRKQAEEALQTSETRYHELFDQLRSIMEGTTHATGEKFLRSLVYNLASALKSRCAFIGEFKDGNHDTITIRAFWGPSRDDAVLPFEYPMKGSPCEQVVAKKEMICVQKDAQKLFSSCPPLLDMEIESYIGFPLIDSDDNIMGVLAVVNDKPVTDVKQSRIIMPIFVARAEVEMERERAEQQLHILFTAVEQSPSTVVITDKMGKVIYANPSLTRTTGYSLAEVIGGSPRLWKSGVHSPEFYAELWRTILSGKEWRSDICNRKKNGELYWELLSILPLKDTRGDISYFIATKVDDTERRRAELKLQHYAGELERSNNALAEFAAIASHDLQEPLRKVTSFGDRLRDHIDDKGLDYLERMQKATVRMQGFIRDLLEYSRVTAKAREFKPTDLQKVVSEVLSDLEVRITQSKAKVEVGSLPTIDADELLMRQLFQNLIVNALKFQKKEAPPLVRINSSYSKGDCQWTIMVEDSGIGFDEKYAERIFKPFERLHGKNEYEGSGIGLAVCMKIVQRHEGRITVKSIPQKGARFYITLPEKHTEVPTTHDKP